jgi:FdhD protein
VSAPNNARSAGVRIVAAEGGTRRETHDDVATEEPLELRLSAGGHTRTLAVTMRTPGNDIELAAGFALGEGIVRSRREIAEVAYCLDPTLEPEQRYNVVTIDLVCEHLPDTHAFERHFTMSSACGVCGRAELQALRDRVEPIDDGARIAQSLLFSLPQRMREAQPVFARTGGLHAAALFALDGELLAVREDVGRHNALDKLIGWALLNDRVPLGHTVLAVSGRTSYEIVQKAVVARIPIVASVSAPSSLAVDLALEFDLTLAGFVRDGRANLYAGAQRCTT